MTVPPPLLRLYAFSVAPGVVEQGGPVATTSEMQRALLDAYDKARLDRALPVSLVVDTTTRTCETRDYMMAIGFGTTPASNAAADALARRLADSMDGRSTPCLLVASATGEGAGTSRHVMVWTFPRDEAFQLSSRANRVKLLDDVFSRSSKLRKAASFEGRKGKTQFLAGRVLDYQANATDRFIADYWVDRFLGAQLQMGSDEGTRFLATTLRVANDALVGDPIAQEQIHAAIIAVRHDKKERWSLRDFSGRYLTGAAATAFRAAAPNADALGALFDFDRGRFDDLVQFRIYRLDTGVLVSAPFSEVGVSVNLEEQDGTRVLTLSGRVLEQKIRSRAR